MKTDTLLCIGRTGFNRMQYYEWGDHANPRIVICVHGLTRNGRDFDHLAQALSREFRVISPDVAGRGQSDWLEAKEDYGYLQYMADMTSLIARVTTDATQRVDWIGTSMGGILGMMIAATPRNPIRRLILNDIGMLVAREGLQRLATFVGKDPRFTTIEELEAYLRRVSAPFGALTDAQWHELSAHGSRQYQNGMWGLSYDPAIGRILQSELNDIDLSTFWNAVTCPTLLLRGADSDLLRHETAVAMTRSGPEARLVEFKAVGHAPMLMAGEQISVVREFLLETAA